MYADMSPAAMSLMVAQIQHSSLEQMSLQQSIKMQYIYIYIFIAFELVLQN
jgi:hypothetical protein